MNSAIKWFAGHRVAANLMMVLILFGGLISVGIGPVIGILDSLGIPASEKLPSALTRGVIRQEVFPEFDLDLITISVVYLGAAPEEVEEGVCLRIEEAIQGLDGVKKVTSVASEGVGLVNVELLLGADSRKVLDDVKARVDAIETFPEETEKPVISEVTNRRQVIDVAVSGDADEASLRYLAEQVRDEITALPGITVAELASARPYEISIEVSEQTLRRHGLTFDFVANAVRRSSLDLPGGSLKTQGGEILLRTKGQAYDRIAFESLVLLTRPDGTHLRLGDVATVIDGFEDTDQAARFDGKPAVLISVFRIGNQDALWVADSVKQYVEEARAGMPEGVRLTTWNDGSQILRARRNLLVRNGLTGFLLVVTMLALFLRLRLALWVSVGLLISFMGTFWLMPTLDVSINLISLFAFILVLGIVVDDAIIVGENIHTEQHRTGEGLQGAIDGAIGVGRPVVFAVLTTVAAFAPLLNVAGTMGKIMRVIPLVVIPCLLWSLVESLWILPAHLSHYKHVKKAPRRYSVRYYWTRFQSAFADGLQRFIRRVYQPSLEFGLRWRYATIAVGVVTLLTTFGLVGGGYVRFFFFPDVEADFISAALTLPPGTPAETTSEAVRRLERGAEEVRREAIEETGQDPFKYAVSSIGEQPFLKATSQTMGATTGRDVFSNLGELTVELLPAETRAISSAELAQRWREATGSIPDAIELAYTASLFRSGEDINVQLTGADMDELRRAADDLKGRLASFAGTRDITDSFREGKEELQLDILPAAEMLGLTLADLGRQVRQAFYGEEAQRIQRGRNEVRVMVRYPEDERKSLGDLENMRIRTPDGNEVPFSEVAVVKQGRGYATIRRVDRRRAIDVTADVDPAQATPGDIIAALKQEVLPDLKQDYPGIRYSFEGQAAEQRDSLSGLAAGFALALVLIYALLAIPLRSYTQPLLIMSAIPFGAVGAIWGHMIMGHDLTILSMFGLVALTGVVVNDSLVMVDFINRHREKAEGLLGAVRQAGGARFRAILLTSLTTFAGLFPLMMEKSMQARFLIPMAISLAFGVIFATFITLILVPSGYMVLEDLKELPARLRERRTRLGDREEETRGGAELAPPPSPARAD
jgi:multidrug efflux pump subunit AcrB